MQRDSTLLGWEGLGFSFRIHGQEFTSFLRRRRWKTLRDFQVRPRETFLYTCGGIDLWEWELRLLDSEARSKGDDAPLCLAGLRMKFRVEVICVNDQGAEQRSKVMEMERRQLEMATLGLSLTEGKSILQGVQDFVASEQRTEGLQRRRNCPQCGHGYHSKEMGTSTVKTVFGPVAVPNPRWERCACQVAGPKTFRPTATWLKGRTSPELLYLETKWGSLIPFAKGGRLLKEALPVGESTNHETVREHVQGVAERMEAELGEER